MSVYLLKMEKLTTDTTIQSFSVTRNQHSPISKLSRDIFLLTFFKKHHG